MKAGYNNISNLYFYIDGTLVFYCTQATPMCCKHNTTIHVPWQYDLRHGMEHFCEPFLVLVFFFWMECLFRPL